MSYLDLCEGLKDIRVILLGFKKHLNLTAKAEGYTTTQLVCRNHWGMSERAHIQRSPPPPLLSCLCRERLNSFDSTVKLLIWCWASAGSLSTLYFRFRHSLIKLRWGRAWAWVWMTNVKGLVKGLFGELHYLFQLRQLSMVPSLVPALPHNPQPFAWCTCKCCLCQTEALGAFWKADEYITYSRKLDSDINNFKVHLFFFFVQEDQEVPCQQLQAVLDASSSKVSVSFKNHTSDKSFIQDNVRSGAGTINYFHNELFYLRFNFILWVNQVISFQRKTVSMVDIK